MVIVTLFISFPPYFLTIAFLGQLASLNVTYTIMEEKNPGRVNEKFLLRKQEDGRWKIVGWERIDNAEVESK